jgi:hypothetical protein
MAKEGKSAISSLTIWASLVSFGTGLLQVAQEVSATGLLPTHWSSYIVSAAGILGVIGRVRAAQPITKL